jgi:hypothetical protein
VQHPVPAALIAYARFTVDFDDQVSRHIERCRSCAERVEDAQLSSPSSAEERRVLASLALHQDALLAAAEQWAKPR